MRSSGTLVVVSFYDERPHDPLHALLAQLDPEVTRAGLDLVVVVNSVRDRPTPLPPLAAKVSLLYRENTGMNIGAWDWGWRTLRGYARYIFLQDDCVVLRPGWPEAFAAALDDPAVGLVGESINSNRTWQSFDPAMPILRCYPILQQWGIDPGERATHLQSLIWAARGETLEAIDGFPIGRTKRECIAAEIGVSRRLVSMGLQIRQLGHRRFAWISHPQWDRRSKAAATPS